MVHGIVKSHGGHITCESRIDRGSSFCVYLPRIIREAPPVGKSETDLHGGDEHILIIDDEEFIVKMHRQILEKLGCRVSGGADSVEALRLFERDH